MKDGRYHGGYSNLQNQLERNNFRLAGIPSKVLRKPEVTYDFGMALVEKLRIIEEQMTIFEDHQTQEFLELLPWWEERRKYRAQKALGNLPEVTWWEAIAFLESVYPLGMTDGTRWGFKKKKPKPKKRIISKKQHG